MYTTTPAVAGVAVSAADDKCQHRNCRDDADALIAFEIEEMRVP